jgi:dipeptidase
MLDGTRRPVKDGERTANEPEAPMRASTKLPALVAACAACTAVLAARSARPCTNIIITPGASADGATMITYAADAHTLYGALEFRPARNHPAGARRKIFDWDTNKFLGTIPETRQTYRVVGHINEHQLVIAETTFTGREELKDPKGLIDYGSLMFIALERAKTAREAIKVMTDLVAEHGYASTGESFSLGDPQ